MCQAKEPLMLFGATSELRFQLVAPSPNGTMFYRLAT
jgi:hypothetical protein